MFEQEKTDVFEVEFEKQRVFKLSKTPVKGSVQVRYGGIVNNVPMASGIPVEIKDVDDNLLIISKEEHLLEGDHIIVRYLYED